MPPLYVHSSPLLSFTANHPSQSSSYSLTELSSGSHKIKYNGSSDWDFHLDASQVDRTIDLALVLPHCRARHQPPEHRMNMFVGAESRPVDLKVVSRTSISVLRIYLMKSISVGHILR